jgi:hypothetical protein
LPDDVTGVLGTKEDGELGDLGFFARAAEWNFFGGDLAATGQGQDSGFILINPGVPWPATDALGRDLPLTAEVGPPKKDRVVSKPFDRRP